MEQPRIINNRIFYDERGSFSPLSLFELDKEWKQSNISVNPKKFTLRGLHYQSGETAQAKLIKVINGRILDFVVDLRVPLRSYNNCQFFEMKSGDELIVPRGFAHGFITLEDNTVTIRHRDSMEQERVSISELKAIIAKATSISVILEKLNSNSAHAATHTVIAHVTANSSCRRT